MVAANVNAVINLNIQCTESIMVKLFGKEHGINAEKIHYLRKRFAMDHRMFQT